MTDRERQIVQAMVDETGAMRKLPGPFDVRAVYASAADADVKFAVFVDADGREWRTGLFRMLRSEASA